MVKDFTDFKNKHRGERCFVVGNGPSLNDTPMESLKNEYTIGCNRVYLGFPKWGYNFNYWGIEDTRVAKDTAKEWNEIDADAKFIPKDLWHLVTDTDRCVPINFVRENPYTPTWPSYSINPDKIYWGFSVIYMMLQIACVMGFDPIYLIGMDHHYTRKTDTHERGNEAKLISSGSDPDHFDPNYFAKGRKYHMPRTDMSTLAFNKAAREAAKYGITILNASTFTKLNSFGKVDINKVI